ncbi:NAD-dependent deacetylase family protein [Streptococcus constellatus subsp. constellatus SK53]|uniref:protein acetyllysine N-acetyltransferase n=1 Tax=Streptococcus constellatus subsp. constellatus SK53 TaxID=1095730 RepID=A0AAD2SXG4_STRCV|nr:NAD-dependent deacetylase family protein [Streptococcus constellatus subsp. constellatus SK53]
MKIHGSVDRNYCTNCHRFYDLEDFLRLSGTIPYCETCGYIVKPDVTLYEESLNMDVFSQAIQAISRADLLIIGGTSLVVYPAANLVHYFQGRQLVLINKSNTVQDNQADLVIKGKIGEVLSKVWKLTDN